MLDSGTPISHEMGSVMILCIVQWDDKTKETRQSHRLKKMRNIYTWWKAVACLTSLPPSMAMDGIWKRKCCFMNSPISSLNVVLLWSDRVTMLGIALIPSKRTQCNSDDVHERTTPNLKHLRSSKQLSTPAKKILRGVRIFPYTKRFLFSLVTKVSTVSLPS